MTLTLTHYRLSVWGFVHETLISQIPILLMLVRDIKEEVILQSIQCTIVYNFIRILLTNGQMGKIFSIVKVSHSSLFVFVWCILCNVHCKFLPLKDVKQSK